MEKHAYLVIAHKYDDTFRTLIRMLDDPRNDIFIHFDIKNKEYDPDALAATVKHSYVYHTKRTDIQWGGASQINAELLLLKLATRTGHYKYYHLVSGQDLPIKSQDYIHTQLADGKYEYVEFFSDKPECEYRVRYFQFLSPKLSLKENEERRIKVQAVEDKLHIRRGKNIRFRKGANWFSITDDLARYVVSKELWIRFHFMMTICADEIFLQTVIRESPFFERVCRDCPYNVIYSWSFRYVNWLKSNGINPPPLTMEDLGDMQNSTAFFARKFDCSVDAEIINQVFRLYGPSASNVQQEP